MAYVACVAAVVSLVSGSRTAAHGGLALVLLALFAGLTEASPKPQSLRAAAEHPKPGEGMLFIRLRKRSVRSPNTEAQAGLGGQRGNRTFFVGRVLVGQPQRRLLVAFDTASGQVVLPSSKCRSATCLQHRCYTPDESSTAMDINANGTPVQEGIRLAGRFANRDAITIGLSSLDLGDGKVCGDLVKETLCLDAVGDESSCAQVGMVAATDMTDIPFQSMPHDGIIGLGLNGLSINPLFNFLGRLVADSSGLQPRFGLFLGQHAGELVFGGHNSARMAEPLSWSPVEQPEQGYWQVRILSVRVGNRTLNFCGEGGVACRGIIDTGASRLGVPTEFMPTLESALSTTPSEGDGAEGSSCHGPELHFELDGATLTLQAEDYSWAPPECGARLASLDLPQDFAGAFVLGEAVLKRYYTAFDLDPPRIGFAHAQGRGEAPSIGEEEAEASEDLAAMAEAARARAASDLGARGPEHGLQEQEEEQTPSYERKLLTRALVMQALIILLLSFTSSPAKPAQLVIARLQSVLAQVGLLPDTLGVLATVPAGEEPMGDECVICLGSCEDECGGKASEAVEGASRLQAVLSRLGVGVGQRPSQRPRWCRLRCGHHFHEQCIYEWLWKVPRCPVCRFHILDSGSSTSLQTTSSRAAEGVADPRASELTPGVVLLGQGAAEDSSDFLRVLLS